MGRLTLNILLSFAQFEREVIGERIRDKFAASRKRGMWMGGWSPAPRVDRALVKAVRRPPRWRQRIESGKYGSSAELAKAEKVNDSYLSRILRLCEAHGGADA